MNKKKELELKNKECDRKGTSSSSNSGGAHIKGRPRFNMIRIVKENIEDLEEEEEIEDQESQEIPNTPEVDEERARTPESIKRLLKGSTNEDQESESSDERHRERTMTSQ